MSVRAEIENLHVELGGAEILHGVTLTVEPGEFLTLLGPSGSGKTTTLNAVAGFCTPSAGEIRLGGDVVNHVPPHRRGLGIVFQSYALFPHMTVGDNVRFPLRVRRVPKKDRTDATRRALALVQLGGMEGRTVGSLSGGQQQRVALARALVFEPGLLLLDEPLAALDKQLRDSMQVELKRIQSEIGVTTIAVTHDQTEALTMSDRIAILRAGHLEQIGAPQEVYERPATRFVAEFLGEANLVGVEAADTAGLDRGAGRTGTLVIRPEHCVLGGPGDEGAAGVVHNVSYQGTRHRIVVRVASSGVPPLIVSVPAEEQSPVRAGDNVTVRVVPGRGHVIADGADGGPATVSVAA
jgi:putative spermidine/putrescine transport system ATP-binding protein